MTDRHRLIILASIVNLARYRVGLTKHLLTMHRAFGTVDIKDHIGRPAQPMNPVNPRAADVTQPLKPSACRSKRGLLHPKPFHPGHRTGCRERFVVLMTGYDPIPNTQATGRATPGTNAWRSSISSSWEAAATASNRTATAGQCFNVR